ncbi:MULTISPECIES: hypothetical protein [Microbacterium]|uniref:hypothetical protein n=1 Tax=Microbacterium TaxID=33882 RepID=UPI00217E8BE1|nr:MULTISPECIES: hypothetical protein [Microbacterium]UWF77159.1 hypothetical protein JSY13_10245 [Microbacterium neungamense]WCM55315.1 hypothetical protein JRG78_10230 [Microbacterium sp. EF45047]
MSDVWDGVAEEFLHLYRRGGRLLAVAGADAERSRTAADALADALEARGERVTRVHADTADAAALRTEIVAPFREDRASDRVLLVSGPAGLLDGEARGLWNFTVWQLAGAERPHTAASALVDLTDPGHPSRRFADYCALPSAYRA